MIQTYKKIAKELYESKYHGKEVSLNDVEKGDYTKSKVYVKNSKGKTKKINFNEIGSNKKKNGDVNPKCAHASDPTTAAYWNCKSWGNK